MSLDQMVDCLPDRIIPSRPACRSKDHTSFLSSSAPFFLRKELDCALILGAANDICDRSESIESVLRSVEKA